MDLAPADDTSTVDPSSSSESEGHDHDSSSSSDIDQDFDISFLSTEMEPTHEDTVKVSVSTRLSTPLVDTVESEEPHSPILSPSSEASRDRSRVHHIIGHITSECIQYAQYQFTCII